MSDDLKPQPPSESGDPGGLGPATEKDVDAKLAEAARLAGEIGGQVGVSEASTVEALSTNPMQSIEKGLDEELKDLEHLIQKTKSEVGGDSAVGAEAPAKPAVPSVPDFMAEFMSPEPLPASPDASAGGAKIVHSAGESIEDGTEEAGDGATAKSSVPAQTVAESAGGPPASKASAAPAIASSKVQSPKPGVVGSGTLSISPSATPGGKQAVGKYSLDVKAVQASGEERSEKQAEQSANGVQTVLIRLCETGVNLLERVDRPFAKLGSRVRDVIGLVALATAAVSAIVLAISFL